MPYKYEPTAAELYKSWLICSICSLGINIIGFGSIGAIIVTAVSLLFFLGSLLYLWRKKVKNKREIREIMKKSKNEQDSSVFRDEEKRR